MLDVTFARVCFSDPSRASSSVRAKTHRTSPWSRYVRNVSLKTHAPFLRPQKLFRRIVETRVKFDTLHPWSPRALWSFAQVSFLRRQSASLWWNFRFISHSRNDCHSYRMSLEWEQEGWLLFTALLIDSRRVIGRRRVTFWVLWLALFESGNHTHSISPNPYPIRSTQPQGESLQNVIGCRS